MNYPWNVLGINVTDDKKAIKKAYAKLIRVYRPDEAPEKFQEINQAYQFALSLVTTAPNVSFESQTVSISKEFQPQAQQQLTTKTGVENEDFIQPDSNNHQSVQQQSIKSEVELSNQAEEDGTDDERLGQQIELMFKQAHEMAFSPVYQRSKLENWAFLEFYHEIHDIDSRDQVAKQMFKRVAEYNLFQLKQNKHKLIPINVIIYMNELFQWEANWHEYSQLFPEHYFKVNFEDIEKKEENISTKYKPSIFTRSSALFVDFLIYYLAVGLLANFVNFDKLKEGWMLFVGFAFIRLMTELLSSNRNSLGVMYLGYRFLDQYLNLPDRKTVLKRFLCFELSMMPLYLFVIIADIFGGEFSMIFISFYAIAILIFVFLRKGQFPQDYFSNTVAVKK